jgi:hypothetical protein
MNGFGEASPMSSGSVGDEALPAICNCQIELSAVREQLDDMTRSGGETEIHSVHVPRHQSIQ